MSERLYRVNQSDNESLPASKVRRIAQGAWTAAAAALWGARSAPASAVFLGDGLAAVPGSGLTVNLSRGLALGRVVTGDLFTHDLRPMLAVEPVSVGLAANVGVDPRIDLVCVKPEEAEEDAQIVYVKDPISSTISAVSRPQRVAQGFVVQVVAGVPGAVPAAPAVPAGYAAVAEVLVAPAAGSFLASDITDRRALDVAALGEVKARAGKVQLGNDTAGATLRRFATALSPFAAGDVALLTQAWVGGGAADAKLHVGQLVAAVAGTFAQVRAAATLAMLPIRDALGTTRIGIDAKNAPWAIGIMDGSGGFVSGYNVSDMVAGAGASGSIRMTFTTAHTGSQTMATFGVTSNTNPTGRTVTRDNTAYLDFKMVDAAGVDASLTGRVIVVVYFL